MEHVHLVQRASALLTASIPTAAPILDGLRADALLRPALTKPDMFAGSPTMAYLHSGSQLPVVPQSATGLDNLAVTAGHVNGAVVGSQMITQTGRLSLATGIILPAVVCPEPAANLINMRPLLNA